MSITKTTGKPESNLPPHVRAAISQHALIARGDNVIVGVSPPIKNRRLSKVKIGSSRLGQANPIYRISCEITPK